MTTRQMQQIEASLFAAGMPVAALMEKVAGRIAAWIEQHYPRSRTPRIGFVVGPGHNGGDALVVARELHHQGYEVLLWCPYTRTKELTTAHKTYLHYIDVAFTDSGERFASCSLIIDGGFGFGLERPVEGIMATMLEQINRWPIPVVSIDIPSGLATDTGQVMGAAIQATQTLCLGLWKLGLFQDAARPYVGDRYLIPFDIPNHSIASVIDTFPSGIRLSDAVAKSCLPLDRAVNAHKYMVGHLLLIAGSQQYAGAALLAGKGAIASGVGMLTLVVPASLKLLMVSELPEALVVGAPETPDGAIAELPPDWVWDKYDVVACGPGMTLQADHCLERVFASDRPLVLDADGLNWLAQRSPVEKLRQRSAPTLLTPHLGEFRRLFPDWLNRAATPSVAAHLAAQSTSTTIVLKGATSAIAHVDGQLWFNADSTPALARGGSGDVLTGLVGGLTAQHFKQSDGTEPGLLEPALGAVWWHAQAGQSLAATHTVLGGAPSALADALLPTLRQFLDDA
ncbi:MAG: NAD(P)H-hydrate dehydratase [Cyanobacteria bacterium P01_H01_bin.58]